MLTPHTKRFMMLLSGCHDCMKDIDYPVNICKLFAKQEGNCESV